MKLLRLYLLPVVLFLGFAFNAQSQVASPTIAELEQMKKKAVADQDYLLANDINIKIKKAKEEEKAREEASPAGRAKALEELDKAKKEAVAAQNYLLAGEIQKKIKAIKEMQAAEEKAAEIAKANAGAAAAKEKEIQELEKAKKEAVAAQNYALAGEINNKIKALKNIEVKQAEAVAAKGPHETEIEELEKEKKAAVAAQNYALAGQINNRIKALKGESQTPQSSSQSTALASDRGYRGQGTAVISGAGGKIRNAEDNDVAGIKFRRSSLYTMMINDNSRLYANVIQDAFVNSPLPEKFNNHNLSQAVINGSAGASVNFISNYLSTNDIAKAMVAKWFNRSEKGTFNMNLVKKRGAYDASAMDINLARNSARGWAVIEDAGEELIGNTFVVINDFKYVNKEDVANKTKTGLGILNIAASLIPGAPDLSAVTTVASTAATVAGKGYMIKTTSYLYRLVWNTEIANTFFNNYWMDDSNYDPAKKQAFENSNLFTLRYIGSETAWADLQSNVFTSKTEEELIHRATEKAVDAGIAKLQRKFEEFRTKSPLYSGNPIAAKIGMKEGLEGGDKFEVLEQVQDPETGKTSYVRKGVIRVDARHVWDNRYEPDEMDQRNQQQDQFTIFSGSGAYYEGMLIRQINN